MSSRQEKKRQAKQATKILPRFDNCNIEDITKELFLKFPYLDIDLYNRNKKYFEERIRIFSQDVDYMDHPMIRPSIKRHLKEKYDLFLNNLKDVNIIYTELDSLMKNLLYLQEYIKDVCIDGKYNKNENDIDTELLLSPGYYEIELYYQFMFEYNLYFKYKCFLSITMDFSNDSLLHINSFTEVIDDFSEVYNHCSCRIMLYNIMRGGEEDRALAEELSRY